MAFPVLMYGWESWTIPEAEHGIINEKYIKGFLVCGQNEKSPQKLKQTKQIYTFC